MTDQTYLPPCRVVDCARVSCEACGKEVSVHCLKYRHLCLPAVERARAAASIAQQGVQVRAKRFVEGECVNTTAAQRNADIHVNHPAQDARRRTLCKLIHF